MADSNKKSGAPSFYSAAADMAMSNGGKTGAGANASGDGASSAEEAKIVATLLEVIDKWSQMTKDPKRKEKIQQIASIAKEIQSGMSGGEKAPPAETAAPAPDAMGAGAGAGAGTPSPAPM